MKARVKQESRTIRKKGKANAPWLVEWRDPQGKKHLKSCGLGREGKKLAEKLQAKLIEQLTLGTYRETPKNKSWVDFLKRFKRDVLQKAPAGTRDLYETALIRFAELVNPKSCETITASTIDLFVSRRLSKGIGNRKPPTAPTINKDLRHIRAALKWAKRWDYMRQVPEFKFEKEYLSIKRFVPPEHFELIYNACEHARLPKVKNIPAPDWWRALLTTCYMNGGWRIGQILKIERSATDLTKGAIRFQPQGTKGKREEYVPLHPFVVEHLKRILSLHRRLFPWPKSIKRLYDELHYICGKAGVPEYGFHDFRRGFATNNFQTLTGPVLQAFMQHKSFATTMKYINAAKETTRSAKTLFAPKVADLRRISSASKQRQSS